MGFYCSYNATRVRRQESGRSSKGVKVHLGIDGLIKLGRWRTGILGNGASVSEHWEKISRYVQDPEQCHLTGSGYLQKEKEREGPRVRA